MKNKERGDSLEKESCNACNRETEHKYFGLIPNHMMGFGTNVSWFEAKICSECGSLTPIPPKEEIVNDIEADYVNYLIDNDIINEDEKERWLTVLEQNKDQ